MDNCICHLSPNALWIAVQNTGVTLIILNHQMQGPPLRVHRAAKVLSKWHLKRQNRITCQIILLQINKSKIHIYPTRQDKEAANIA